VRPQKPTRLERELLGQRIVAVDDKTDGKEDGGYVVLHLEGGRLYADAPTYHENATHTPNGFDPAWVAAFNAVLRDRQGGVRIVDLDDAFWAAFIGPAVDAIEDGEYLADSARPKEGER
jgi:hypothetical protein